MARATAKRYKVPITPGSDGPVANEEEALKVADELGYLEINSFYRAFRRWTGLTYSEYKLRYC